MRYILFLSGKQMSIIGTPQTDQPTQDVGITSDNFCQLKGSYLEVLSTHFLQSERKGKTPLWLNMHTESHFQVNVSRQLYLG